MQHNPLFRTFDPSSSPLLSLLLAAAALLTAPKPACAQDAVAFFALPSTSVPPPPAPAVRADFEGYGVAGSERLIVVGRPGREVQRDGTEINAAGQVLVWNVEDGYLKKSWVIDAPNPGPGFYFGGAVAAGTRWIAVSQGPSRVGVPGATAVSKSNRVQLIEFPPDGDWNLGPELFPTGVDAGSQSYAHQFGHGMVMQGNRLIVSAPGSTPGAVFVYDVNDAGVWNRTQRIDGPFPAREGAFGQAIAMSGDLLVVGVPLSPAANGGGLLKNQGGAYIYRKGSDGLYVLEKELRAPDGAASDAFGKAVAVEVREDVEIVAIGAPLAEISVDTRNFGNAGAVYIFERPLPSGDWVMTNKIFRFSAGGPSTGDESGLPLALGHGALYVGSGGSAKGLYRVSSTAGWQLLNTFGQRVYTFQNGALASFARGFLVGSGDNLSPGAWSWLMHDSYDGLVNSPGAWLGTTTTTTRRADADPDQDGIPNGQELFFGTPPMVANTNRILQPTRDLATKQFRLRWQEAAQTYGLKSYLTWASSTPTTATNWTTSGIQILSLGIVPGTSQRAFEARLPFAGKTNVFFRFEIR